MTPPNPLARLVGELPKLRERTLELEKIPRDTIGNHPYICELISAHAIAIEAIERLERVEKALKEIVAEYKAHDTAAIDAIYQIAADALAALAAEPDKQKEK